MALRDVFLGIFVVVVACAETSACAGMHSGAGDETHFQTCQVDRDCDGGYRCEAHTCRPGPTDVPADGSGGQRGADQGGGKGGSGQGGGHDGSAGGVTGGPICKLIDETNGDADAATVARILGDAATSCELRASDYDRSCQHDSDCVEVGVGNACTVPCIPACPNTAINVRDMARYQADYDRTPLGTCMGILCGCPAGGSLHCVRGVCELVPFGARSPMDASVD